MTETRPRVMEHPAPPGALRLHDAQRSHRLDERHQGAPSTTRCIKTLAFSKAWRNPSGCQGAPSTIRCIKTRASGNRSHATMRGQGAPSTINCSAAW